VRDTINTHCGKNAELLTVKIGGTNRLPLDFEGVTYHTEFYSPVEYMLYCF
jgi:hypothetical protein